MAKKTSEWPDIVVFLYSDIKRNANYGYSKVGYGQIHDVKVCRGTQFLLSTYDQTDQWISSDTGDKYYNIQC